nr:GpE family phage tail protein [Asticcacaulis sp. AC460]
MACVFHWPPPTLWEMDCEELLIWHGRAMKRYRAMNGIKDE